MKIRTMSDLEEVNKEWEVGEPDTRSKVAFCGACCNLWQAGPPELGNISSSFKKVNVLRKGTGKEQQVHLLVSSSICC